MSIQEEDSEMEQGALTRLRSPGVEDLAPKLDDKVEPGGTGEHSTGQALTLV